MSHIGPHRGMSARLELFGECRQHVEVGGYEAKLRFDPMSKVPAEVLL